MIKNKKAFTLIELIVVLIIIIIIVLISVPLITSIISKSKDNSAKRSVDNYGKIFEESIMTYLMENGRYPDSLDDVTIDYSGPLVECETKKIFDNGAIYLTKCKVNGKYVLDKNGESGYYVYGKKYGLYKLGDQITYKDIQFRVLKNSDEFDTTVTLIKEEPLEYDLVAEYAPGIIYDLSKIGKVLDYAYVPYYSRAEGCNGTDNSACNSEYLASDVKKIIDLWVSDKLDYDDLVDDDSDGAFARLITTDEYGTINTSIITWRLICEDSSGRCGYWTMSPDGDTKIWYIRDFGSVWSDVSSESRYVSSTMRPVIVVKKSALKM